MWPFCVPSDLGKNLLMASSESSENVYAASVDCLAKVAFIGKSSAACKKWMTFSVEGSSYTLWIACFGSGLSIATVLGLMLLILLTYGTPQRPSLSFHPWSKASFVTEILTSSLSCTVTSFSCGWKFFCISIVCKCFDGHQWTVWQCRKNINHMYCWLELFHWKTGLPNSVSCLSKGYRKGLQEGPIGCNSSVYGLNWLAAPESSSAVWFCAVLIVSSSFVWIWPADAVFHYCQLWRLVQVRYCRCVVFYQVEH